MSEAEGGYWCESGEECLAEPASGVAVMRELNAVIHDQATPDQALDLFETIKN